MPRVVQIIDGVHTTVELPSTLTYYKESILITTDIGTPQAGVSADHKTITLPNGETYDGTTDQLRVLIGSDKDGVLPQVEGVDFNYDNNVAATTVALIKAIPKDARIEFEKVK